MIRYLLALLSPIVFALSAPAQVIVPVVSWDSYYLDAYEDRPGEFYLLKSR